jgi:hypothetical protein
MEAPSGNPVLHYLAVLKAARDWGVPQHEIEAVAGRFDPRRLRSAELADAFADLILSRRSVPPHPSAGCSG